MAQIIRADVLVLSSIYEGLPSVLIEGLACGINIISVRCKNAPEEILLYGDVRAFMNYDAAVIATRS
jgi:glycosyltransferase involved in cell wall biosynthesis